MSLLIHRRLINSAASALLPFASHTISPRSAAFACESVCVSVCVFACVRV